MKLQLYKRFSFQHVSEATVRNVVKNLPSDKVSAGEIPIKILKQSTLCFPKLTNYVNESLTNNKFPDTLKLSDITPVFKKLDPSDKASYRPLSILPLVSKLFFQTFTKMAKRTRLRGVYWYNFNGLVKSL